MLTSTYALATFSVEQTAIRDDLFACQQHVEARLQAALRPEPALVGAMLDRLDCWHRRSQARKLDRYLVPALRQGGHQAEALLAELEAVSTLGLGMLGKLRKCWQHMLDDGRAWLEQMRTAMLAYCAGQMTRLEREETELLPLARKIIPRETWFALGRQILQCAAASARRAVRPAMRPPPGRTRAAAAALSGARPCPDGQGALRTAGVAASNEEQPCWHEALAG